MMTPKIFSLKPSLLALVCLALTFSFGCAGNQSSLFPAGPQSTRINNLWWVMFWTCSAVFLIVMAALAVALWRHRKDQPQAGERVVLNAQNESQATKIIIGALAISAVILFGFLITDFATGRALTSLQTVAQATGQAPTALQIKVTGYQWWWDFEYEDPVASQHVRLANEFHLPLGRPAQLRMTAQDVIHSFWAPNLHGKTDLLPGQQTTTWLQADRPGIYRGQCAEFCGYQHAHMAFVVIAEPPEQFNTWLDNQRRPAMVPTEAGPKRGQEIFLTYTCVMCHQIRGTEAGARTAPDLTHLASRQTLAAGTLANNRDNLKGWIVDSQHYKPGNRMPTHQLSDEDLNALVEYLEMLK